MSTEITAPPSTTPTGRPDVERAALAAVAAAVATGPLAARGTTRYDLLTEAPTTVLRRLATGSGRIAESARRTVHRDPDLTSAIARLNVLAEAGIRLIAPGDPEWPTQVDDLGTETPIALWVQGILPDWSDGSLSIVGSRNTSDAGLSFIDQTVRRLPVPVISGLALGADGAAHRAALNHDVPTVAVLPAGLQAIYPRVHESLAARILTAGGALISEYPAAAVSARHRFLERNRLVAALTPGTLIVEADERSGTTNTAGHVGRLGRRLGAVPGTRGCDTLIRSGAAVAVETQTDVDWLFELN